MSSLLEGMRHFFEKLENDEEGKKVLSFLERDFQFKLADGGSFVMSIRAKRFSFEQGELPDQNFRRVTPVYTDEATLMDLMAGRVSPSEAYFSQRIGGWPGSSRAYSFFSSQAVPQRSRIEPIDKNRQEGGEYERN